MNDLLPIPAERDFPHGRLEARRAALVTAIRVDMAREPLAGRVLRHITKSWLWLVGILTLGLALVAIGVSGQPRPSQSGAVALLALAGAAPVAVAVAPRAHLNAR